MTTEQTAFKHHLRKVLSFVTYPKVDFCIVVKNDMFFIQVRCDSKCNTTGAPYQWKGRKWFVSSHSTDSEIVQTCFKAIITALEHEAREKFMFLGQPVFRPHLDVYDLFDLSMRGKIDIREDNVRTVQ